MDEPEKVVAYSMTDGETGIRHITKTIGRGFGSVQGWWKEWLQIGIAEAIKVKGGGSRAVATFKLEDFGIRIPEIIGKTTNDQTETEKNEQRRDS